MSPSSTHASLTKSSTPQRSDSQDFTSEGIRKRVCKACDRCRLKKSKCDGSHPCSRCKLDNAICVFGERKKSHDKVFPKGYVEMLEQQQAQLVTGLQEMYRRAVAAGSWTGSVLPEMNGHPLTHDLLAALDLLDTKHDGSGDVEAFEEDCGKLQSKLLADGAGFTQRRGSLSSESEHSHGHARSTSRGPPKPSIAVESRDSFDFSAPPSPPPEQSPVQGHRQTSSFHTSQPTSMQQDSPLEYDPQFYQAEWAFPEVSNPNFMLRSKFALHAPELDHSLNLSDLTGFAQWDASPVSYDATYDMNMPGVTSHAQQFNAYGSLPRVQDGSAVGTVDPMMDVEFNQFIQVMS